MTSIVPRHFRFWSRLGGGPRSRRRERGCAQEERFTRKKHDPSVSKNAIEASRDISRRGTATATSPATKPHVRCSASTGSSSPAGSCSTIGIQHACARSASLHDLCRGHSFDRRTSVVGPKKPFGLRSAVKEKIEDRYPMLEGAAKLRILGVGSVCHPSQFDAGTLEVIGIEIVFGGGAR